MLTYDDITRQQWVKENLEYLPYHMARISLVTDFDKNWNKCWLSTPHIYLVNSLWPSDAIWRQGFRSTLVQVMACCLTAPSHYLNQCWLIITKVQWCSSKGNFAWDIWLSQPSVTKISLKIIFKILLKSPRGQWVKNTDHFPVASIIDDVLFVWGWLWNVLNN